MPFKGTLPRVDSSALTDSLPPAVEFMEGEATTGFGVSRISPPRAFSPTSRAHPFSPFPSTPPLPSPLPAKKKKKHRSFPPFSCCLPSSPLSFAPRLIPAKVERVLNSFAFRFSSFLLQLRHSAPVACRACLKSYQFLRLFFLYVFRIFTTCISERFFSRIRCILKMIYFPSVFLSRL